MVSRSAPVIGGRDDLTASLQHILEARAVHRDVERHGPAVFPGVSITPPFATSDVFRNDPFTGSRMVLPFVPSTIA